MNIGKVRDTFTLTSPSSCKARSFIFSQEALARKKKDTGNGQSLVVHQLLLSEAELPNEGPAAMLANEKHWFTQWSANPQMLKPRAFESFPLSPRICNLWKETTGDPGWAGTPVEAWAKEESCALIATPEIKSRTVIQMLAGLGPIYRN